MYAATAFVVLQVAELLLPPLGVPDWGMGLVVALTALGFPLALVVGWALEVTPDGIRRTEAATSMEPVPTLFGKRTALAAALLLAVGGGIGTGWFLKPSIPDRDETVAVGPRLSRSVAVLRATCEWSRPRRKSAWWMAHAPVASFGWPRGWGPSATRS